MNSPKESKKKVANVKMWGIVPRYQANAVLHTSILKEHMESVYEEKAKEFKPFLRFEELWHVARINIIYSLRNKPKPTPKSHRPTTSKKKNK